MMKLITLKKSNWVAWGVSLVILCANASAYEADDSLDVLLPDHALPGYFVDSFNGLMRTQWHHDGNWGGDFQNDATAFAPELLYQIDAAIDGSGGPFYQRAYQTAEWESHLIDDAIKRFFQGALTERDAFDIAVGTYSFLACARYGQPAEAKVCRRIIRPIINLANFAFLSGLFERLGLFEGQEATLYARLAFMNVEYFYATGLATYRRSAERLVAKMEALADEDQDGVFDGAIFGWSQASPLVAFASLYEATGDARYRDKADRMIAVLDQGYLFGTPGETEAYWEIAHNDLQTNEHFWVLASSTHSQFVEAFITMWAASGEAQYGERAERFQEFAVQHFYIPNHGGTDPHFSHDIAWPVGVTQPTSQTLRYNDDYCTGETFNFLRLGWRLHNG